MPVTANGQAPYAPPRTLLDVIDRYRDRGLPAPINQDVLARSGVVSDSLIPRTLQAMQLLDLIDEKGAPTESFESIRRAPQAEFKSRMQDWLKLTYNDVFAFVDPTKDDAVQVRDAFRSYNPTGQQDRMTVLFMGLCAAAGLLPEKPQAAPTNRMTSIRPRVTAPVRIKNKMLEPVGNAGAHRQTGLPPAVEGLLAMLPKNGKGWTQEKRDSFTKTFGIVLDFVYPIVEAEEDEVDGGQ